MVRLEWQSGRFVPTSASFLKHPSDRSPTCAKSDWPITCSSPSRRSGHAGDLRHAAENPRPPPGQLPEEGNAHPYRVRIHRTGCPADLPEPRNDRQRPVAALSVNYVGMISPIARAMQEIEAVRQLDAARNDKRKLDLEADDENLRMQLKAASDNYVGPQREVDTLKEAVRRGLAAKEPTHGGEARLYPCRGLHRLRQPADREAPGPDRSLAQPAECCRRRRFDQRAHGPPRQRRHQYRRSQRYPGCKRRGGEHLVMGTRNRSCQPARAY